MKLTHWGLALVVVAIFSMAIGTGTALAAPEWYATSTPEWQQAGTPLAEPIAVVWKGTVAFTDEKEHLSIKCEDTGEGTVGPTSAGTETTWTLSKCARVEGTCEAPSLEAVDLPWSTKLSYSESATRETITENGKGAPGYKSTCTVLGIKVTDKCTGTTTRTLANSSVGVEATFVGKGLTCSLSKGVGKLEGTQSIEAKTGGRLQVAQGPFGKLGGALEVRPSGALTITDTKWLGGVSVACSSANMNGTIEAAGKGTITSYAVSGCSSSKCSEIGAQSLHLPWKTELAVVGGVDRYEIVGGGSGTPEWRFTCKIQGVEYEDVCGLSTSARTINESGGVLAKLDSESAKTQCTRGGAEAGQWEGALTIAPPASVQAIRVE